MVFGLQGTLAQAQTVYYHNDSAGSPIAATDEAGNLLWKESYRPYGERMLKPAASNMQWFHGKQLDPDTGMEDFGARNYDPVLGRFLSIDPVDFQDKNIHSLNRYAYGNNNPLKYKDPDGRFGLAIVGFIAVAATVVLGGYLASPQNGLSSPPSFPAQREAHVSPPPSESPTALGLIGGYVGSYLDWRQSVITSMVGPKYENPGTHDIGGGRLRYDPSKSVLPSNHQDLWDKSKSFGDEKTRWTKEGSGKKAVYHRFQDDNNGTFHWNGSTAGETKAGQDRSIPIEKVPTDLIRGEGSK